MNYSDVLLSGNHHSRNLVTLEPIRLQLDKFVFWDARPISPVGLVQCGVHLIAQAANCRVGIVDPKGNRGTVTRVASWIFIEHQAQTTCATPGIAYARFRQSQKPYHDRLPQSVKSSSVCEPFHFSLEFMAVIIASFVAESYVTHLVK